MSTIQALETYLVPERFEKALKSIRVALQDMELEVVGEFRLSENVRIGPERKPAQSRVLLVSCPILDFEALALGSVAAVFFPLHILVSAERDETCVSIVNPASLMENSFPVGASEPMDRLVARVTLALQCLGRRADARLN